jgi:hypothetical protein
MDADATHRARRAREVQSGVLLGVSIAVFCPIVWYLTRGHVHDFRSDSWYGGNGNLPLFILHIVLAAIIAAAIAFVSGVWVSLRLQRWVDSARRVSSEEWRERVAREVSERRPSGPSSSPAHPRP